MRRNLLFALLIVLSGLGSNVRAIDAPQDNWHSYSYLGWSLGALVPRTVAVGADGLVYVAVAANPPKVQVFTQAGTLVREVVMPSTAVQIFGMAANASGELFIYDQGTARLVRVFNASGTQVRSWGGAGTGNGKFGSSSNGRNKLALDSASNVYVVDTANRVVQKFDANGTFLLQWGGLANIPGQFSPDGPLAIQVNPQGNLVVGGCTTGRPIQVFDPNGALISSPIPPNWSISLSSGTSMSLAVLPDGFIVFSIQWGNNMAFQMDETFNLSEGSILPNTAGFATDARGRVYSVNLVKKAVIIHERSYDTENPRVSTVLPQPIVVSSEQRPSTTFVDIDYKVVDSDSANVQVAALAFFQGGNDLSSLLKMTTFVEGTGGNLGANQPSNEVRRITWNAAADWAAEFGDVQFEILANDGRGLMAFHWITLPAQGGDPAVAISHRPVTDQDMLSIWYWLIATSDSAITLTNGKVYGVGGSYDGVMLADTDTTTTEGRAFLYQRMNVRAITAAEMTRATAGNYGFGSVDTSSVVKND